ncbi:MAG: hypothetical protein QOI08_1776 [Actinomycetota bacterium]|jgi:hypothetical protein|nr:hypothetical protein [Actinomycetota bacterium]
MVPELRPRGIGEILDAAVVLYRARFRRLVTVAAAVVIPVQALSAIVLLSAQPDRLNFGVTGSVTPQYNTSSVTTQLAAVIVVGLVTALSTAVITAVCTRIVANAYIGQSSMARDAARAVRPRLFAVVGVSLVVLVSEVIGLAACFIGVLYPLTVFAVAIPVLILEGIGVWSATGRSVTLTKAHAMHVLGLVLTVQLLVAVVNTALVGGVSVLLRSGNGIVAAVIGQSIASTVAGVLTTPFAATAIVVLYFDLRTRDEAFDVQLLMQRNDARARIPA